jgi:signal transduction histidine kinase
MDIPGRDKQFERYGRRMRDRMANRLKSYRKTGVAEFVWKAGSQPWGTNMPARAKYGLHTDPDGRTIGWARADGDTFIGSFMPSFREEDSFALDVFVAGAVMVVLLFFVLSAGGIMLARAAKRARADLELKDSFLDMVSHELNTPLGSIVPLSSALASGRVKDETRRREAIATISRESARMARMISELLTAVRLRNGKIAFAEERVDVRKIAQQAASLVRVRHPDCGIAVAGGGEVFACADPDRTEQVLVNLVENACRHAGGEGVELSCSRTAGGFAEIAVADRGPGVPQEDRKRIFERFYQAGDCGAGGGLGLGLNIVSGFVSGMGGTVEVRPRDGGGSVFTVRLPAFAEESGGKEECDG